MEVWNQLSQAPWPLVASVGVQHGWNPHLTAQSNESSVWLEHWGFSKKDVAIKIHWTLVFLNIVLMKFLFSMCGESVECSFSRLFRWSTPVGTLQIRRKGHTGFRFPMGRHVVHQPRAARAAKAWKGIYLGITMDKHRYQGFYHVYNIYIYTSFQFILHILSTGTMGYIYIYILLGTCRSSKTVTNIWWWGAYNQKKKAVVAVKPMNPLGVRNSKQDPKRRPSTLQRRHDPWKMC